MKYDEVVNFSFIQDISLQAVNAKLAIKFLEGNESSSVNNVLIFIFHIMHCQGCLLIAFNVVLNVAYIVFVSYSEITKSQTRTAAGLSKLPMSTKSFCR